MKKILFIFAFILFAFTLNAQDQIISGYGLKGVTNASASKKTVAYNYVYKVNVQNPYYYAYTVRQNDEGGSPANNTTTAYFQGSVDGTNYTNIDTISYAGSSTYQISTNMITSAPISYTYLRFNITPSDTIWIKSIWLNVLPVK
jgi:hypothetical protein